jgi:hypothetical protein
MATSLLRIGVFCIIPLDFYLARWRTVLGSIGFLGKGTLMGFHELWRVGHSPICYLRQLVFERDVHTAYTRPESTNHDRV